MACIYMVSSRSVRGYCGAGAVGGGYGLARKTGNAVSVCEYLWMQFAKEHMALRDYKTALLHPL